LVGFLIHVVYQDTVELVADLDLVLFERSSL